MPLTRGMSCHCAGLALLLALLLVFINKVDAAHRRSTVPTQNQRPAAAHQSLQGLRQELANLGTDEARLAAAPDIILRLSKQGGASSWPVVESLLTLAQDRKSNLPLGVKDAAARLGVRFRERQGLARVVPLLFEHSPVVNNVTLDHVMRVLVEGHPDAALQAFGAFLSAHHGTDASPTVTTYLHAVNASRQLAPGDESFDAQLLSVVTSAQAAGKLTVSVVVNSLAAARERGAWQAAMQVYAVAKQAVQAGCLYSWRDGAVDLVPRLPSVVYGQCLAACAKGGAAPQAYLVVCEMLQEGVVPTPVTLDFVFLQLSRVGAHAVLLATLEQLQRFRLGVSHRALNAVLNACDKEGAHAAALQLYQRQMRPEMLDALGLGQVIKACDKQGRPEIAVRALLAALGGVQGLNASKGEAEGAEESRPAEEPITSTKIQVQQQKQNHQQQGQQGQQHGQQQGQQQAPLRVRSRQARELCGRVFALLVRTGAADLCLGLVAEIERLDAGQQGEEGDGKKATATAVKPRTGAVAAAAALKPPASASASASASARVAGGSEEGDDDLLEILDEIITFSPDSSDISGAAVSVAEAVVGRAILDQLQSSRLGPSASRGGGESAARGGEEGAEPSPLHAQLPLGVPPDGAVASLLRLSNRPRAPPQAYSAAVAALARAGRAQEAELLLKSFLARRRRPSSSATGTYTEPGAEAEEEREVVKMFTSAIAGWRRARVPEAANRLVNLWHQHSQHEHQSQPQALQQRNSRTPASSNALPGAPLSALNAQLLVHAVSEPSPASTATRNDILSDLERRELPWDCHTFTALMMGEQDREAVLLLWRVLTGRPGDPARAAAATALRERGLGVPVGVLGAPGPVPTTASVAEALKAAVMTKRGSEALAVLRFLWANQGPVSVPPNLNPSLGPDAVGRPAAGSSKGSLPIPDLPMCSLAVAALGRAGAEASPLLMELFDDMRQHGIVPSPACYCAALASLDRAGQWRHAVTLLLQMQRQGLRVDTRAVNYVLSACSRAGEFDMILKLHQQMPALSRGAYVPNELSYTLVTSAGVKANQPKAALALLRDWGAAASASSSPPPQPQQQQQQQQPQQQASVPAWMESSSTAGGGGGGRGSLSPPTFSSLSQVVGCLEAAGLSDDATDVFEGLVEQHLPPNGSEDMVIDLHGFSAAVARASVRSALRLLLKQRQLLSPSLVVITGIGKNVLKPSVCEFLAGQGLVAEELTDNPGRLRIRSESLELWWGDGGRT